MEPKEKKTGITVREAGRLGGQKVLKERGRDFYKEIGQKGGQATRNAYGIDFYKDIGRRGGTKGGEKTRDTYGHTFYKEIGEKGGQVVRDLIRKGKEAKLKEQENQHDE
jgi:general stress protein YciG